MDTPPYAVLSTPETVSTYFGGPEELVVVVTEFSESSWLEEFDPQLRIIFATTNRAKAFFVEVLILTTPEYIMSLVVIGRASIFSTFLPCYVIGLIEKNLMNGCFKRLDHLFVSFEDYLDTFVVLIFTETCNFFLNF